MYPTYEPRDEQIAMALEVRDALVTGTHRVIEAGTGVGKSMAYLVPFAEAARRNQHHGWYCDQIEQSRRPAHVP